MTHVTRRDGNVTYADFGGSAEPDPGPLPEFSMSCKVLYIDGLVALSRLTYWINGQVIVQHLLTEADPEDHA